MQKKIMKVIMNKVVSFLVVIALMGTMMLGQKSLNTTPAATNVIAMPKLEVQGRKLVNALTGKQVQLRGMSTHGIAWYPEYVNKDAFSWLKDNMGISVVRLSMYTSEWGGYCVSTGDKTRLKTLIKNAVEYATSLGLYVIIDWHMLGADEEDMEDCNPMHYVEEAKEFFGEMSSQFKDYNNIIYEICNEPNDGEYGDYYDINWSVIKEYANQVIPVIRKNTDNVIIVGTPDWSSDVTSAANDLNNSDSLSNKYDNIMYTYHFYAASHGSWERTEVENALNAGLPIFVTEFGACEASGDGAIDSTSTKAWLDMLDSYGVSYVKWNLSNKAETSALVSSSCSKTSNWSLSEISESGKYMMNEYITRIQENKYGISAPESMEDEAETTQEPTTEEATTKAESVATVEIDGFQIGTTVEGYRTIYSVMDSNSEVEESGLIYGLADHATVSDMVIGSSNSTVFHYQSTDAGKSAVSFSQMENAQSYTMTMKFIKSIDFYNANLYVRAYAKLKNGEYIYSDACSCSVYEIADYLYQNHQMNTAANHNYLYDNILSVVEPDYKTVDYDWGNIIIKP